MNNQLKEAYSDYYKYLLDRVVSDGLTNPLLLNLGFKDEKNTKSVMIFGKETNDWEGKFGTKSIDLLLNTYSDFYNNGRCYTVNTNFWRLYKELVERIKDIYQNNDIKFIWNNILKLGKEGRPGTPNQNLVDLYIEYPVIQKEIKIINPISIIFVTGPSYDTYIKRIFSDVSIVPVNNKFSVQELARVSSPNLPINTFRTYHPNYLLHWHQKAADYKDRILESMFEAFSI